MTERTNELRQEIAKALGVVVVQTGYGIFYQASVTWKGKTARGGNLEYGYNLAGVPDWPRDPGEALDLMPVNCSLNRCDPGEWPGAWECTMTIDWFLQESITVYADTPEMAICEWYVAYRAALKAQAVDA